MFLVTAMDGTDAGALERRMAVRPVHFERVKPEAEAGRLRTGGAILDAQDRMVGSFLMLDLPDEAAVRAWLDADPYTKGGVWKDFTIRRVRVAELAYAAKVG
jgi:uncharacterized protein YciI